ncbi:uncharacterized protein LOC131886221 [Tigriopus californicus]|uniref:uncharacterized protein LOC131886221 n=1 Tax=Tigriopus californicus TaxID=6832 RepID=UPI0027DA65C7|nr:uncharacterized protein LOC131886221 [Tigriopus californicus]
MAATRFSSAIPMHIPGGLEGGSSASAPPTRNSSTVGFSGSYFGSMMSFRVRKSMTAHMNPSPLMEKKLIRTRRMSEAVRSPESIRGKTPRLMRIPTEIGDITKEWARLVVNQHLFKLDKEMILTEDQITHFHVEDCKSGSGDFSCTYKLDVQVRSSNGVVDGYSFVAKLLPAEDAGRAYVFEANLLEKEIEMYFEVLPSLRAFLRDQKSGDRSAIIDRSVPECVYGSHNMDGAGVLVFNSSLENGFRHCDNPEGLSADELLITVDRLAQIHASGRAFLAEKTEELVRRRYPSLSKDMYTNGLLLDQFNQNLQTYSDLLHSAPLGEFSEAKELFDKLRCEHGVWDMLQGLKRRGPESLNTIIHGELWEKNILFHANEPKCVLLDWKNAKIASPMLDLAFLLFSSSNIHMISTEGQTKVLKAYHTSFCSTLKNLMPKCKPPSFSALQVDFLQTVRDALMQSICIFVQEMEFMENAITKTAGQDVELVNKMQIYERRAMNLLLGIDFASLPRDTDSDEDEDMLMGRASSTPRTLRFKRAKGFRIGLEDDDDDDEDDDGDESSGEFDDDRDASGYISV